MSSGEILMLGDINIDTVWPVSEFPTPGRDGLTETVTVEMGGAVVNSAIVLDNLGQRTGLLGCVGKDVWAEQITKKLAQTTINLKYINIKPESTTGLTFIIVTPDGERTMFSHRGANIQLEIQDIDEDAFKDAALLHISGYALLESPQKKAVWSAVELAKKHNVQISLDTGLEPAIKNPKDLRRLLRELTICISGPQEISELLDSTSPEEAADLLLSSGIRLAAIKLGEKGSFIADEKDQFFCPSFHVDAVDTTGAGDSFTAGLLYGWAHGLSFPASAVLASVLGALAASVYGAGFSLPDKQCVLDFLRSIQSESAAILLDGIEEVIADLGNESVP
jgi:ribokinase